LCLGLALSAEGNRDASQTRPSVAFALSGQAPGIAWLARVPSASLGAGSSATIRPSPRDDKCGGLVMEGQGRGDGGPSATIRLALQDDNVLERKSGMSEVWGEDLGSGVGESISIWAGAESGRRKRTADSSCLASLARRNDKGCGDARSAFDEMTPKELGEFAEAEFLRAVLKMGMAVTKPWGESQGYDFIVDAAGKLTRVQVKAAFRRGKQGGYSLRTYRSSMECYTAKEIDALAGYVAPEEAWYLFPVRVVGRVRSLKLFPGSKKKRSKFEKWREAWWVVTGR